MSACCDNRWFAEARVALSSVASSCVEIQSPLGSGWWRI